MSLRQFIASRKFLRPLSFLQETATNSWNEIASLFGLDDDVFFNPLHRKIESPVKVILIGAGHRGNIYASYMLEYPEEMKIVAVADASLSRRKQAAEEYTIPDQYCFSDWSEIFKRPKFADAVIIATPDQLHTQPCLAALEAGYDVLL